MLTERNDQEIPSGVASFGPFRVRATERVLEKEGVALKITSRAFDILVALAQSAPDVVSNRELMARVWGALVVEEGSLRFQINVLRKTLGETESGAPYVANIPGRGYCLASPVEWTSVAAKVPTVLSAVRIPRRLLRMVGRDQEVGNLVRQLREGRFVSIVGAGGIGKTTVALAVAHEVLSEFSGAVHFLDLATLQEPSMVGRALAAQLGLTVVSDDPLPVLLPHLHGQRLLLILDNCEHLVDAVATLAEALFQDAPEIHILATSRESLRATGEQVHHLTALECPPPDAESLTAAQALAFPAVQLFVEQVAASGYPFELSDDEAPLLARVCRRLDGIPLALELAARRLGVYGLRQIASLIDDQFRLLWKGRRTALPRHQTLQAALDWSYQRLSPPEQLVFRRLAVFLGAFSLEDAVAVAGESLDPAEVAEIIAVLVEKSLMTLDPTASLRYRLLDTTRTYARQQLDESGERTPVAHRHCEYMCNALGRFEVTAAKTSGPNAISFFADRLSNLHAAQEWAFSAHGDAGLAVRLSAASAPLYLQLALLNECVASTGRALRLLDETSRGTRLELELQVCFGLSLLYSTGNAPAVRAAVERGLQLAEELHEPATQVLLLYVLESWKTRSGDYRGHAEIVQRFHALAKQLNDPLADAVAHALAAVTCLHTGELREVPGHARAALSSPVHLSKLNAVSFNNVHTVGARAVFASSLWMLGYPDQALAAAEESLTEAVDLGHPRTIAYVLAWIVHVYLETGKWALAEALTERLLAHATKHRLFTYTPVGIGWQGSLAVQRGEVSQGTKLLERALADLRADGYLLYIRPLSAALAGGYAKAAQYEIAYATVCEAIAWADDHGRSPYSLELLRVKGEILISSPQGDTDEGEACLLTCLHLAHEQSHLSMELRSGMRLARLWADRGLAPKGLELLAPIYGRFTEGFGTSELMAGANLLTQLRSRATSGG
jgi:predicted ATPase/DNA-binding winged helix-turn-helix (wHTH) protein